MDTQSSADGFIRAKSSYGPEGRNFLRPGFPGTSFERRIAKLIRPGMRVLEMGPGPGRFTASAVRRGATVVAVDPRPETQDEILGHRGMKKAVREGRFFFFPGRCPDALAELRGQHFDLFFSQSSVHYLDKAGREACWKEIISLLGDNGRLALAVKSIDNAMLDSGHASERVSGKELRWFCSDQATRSFFTLNGLRRELKQAGFRACLGDFRSRVVQGYERTLEASVWIEVVTSAAQVIPIVPFGGNS